MSSDKGAVRERQLIEADTVQPVIIDSDLVMNGELRFDRETDLIILGSVDGTLIRGVRNLLIGKRGVVSGDVECVTADIAGTLDGRARVSETACVRHTARLRGEVVACRVEVEEGANLDSCVLSGRIRRAHSE